MRGGPDRAAPLSPLGHGRFLSVRRAVTWRGARRAAGVRTRYGGPAAAPDVFCAGARREGVSGARVGLVGGTGLGSFTLGRRGTGTAD